MNPPFLKALAVYKELGWSVFPLSKTKTPLRGQIDWKQDAKITDTPEQDWLDVFGAVIPENFLIVDIDVKKGKTGLDSWQNLCEDLGLNDEERKTMTVQTPTGGYHLYFKKPKDLRTNYKLKHYKDIEFLTSTTEKKHYVVGAGSTIDKEYKLLNSINDIKEAPKYLLELLTTKHEKKKSKTIVSNNPVDVASFEKYLLTTDPAIAGQEGDAQTYKTACYGRDLGLSEDKVLDLMKKHYNPRCVPMWTETEIETKVTNAFNYASGTQGSMSIESQFDEVTPETAEKQANLRWDIHSNKSLKPTLRNCINLLMLHKYVTKFIKQDVFANKIIVTGKLPWDAKRKHRTNRWNDEDLLNLRYWLTDVHNVNFDNSTAQDAVTFIAVENSFHSVQDYLNGLKWDGVPRLETWLSLYCGSEDNEYTRTVGAMTLVAAVKRIFNPGCKYDHMLVLEGGQGIGKSTICQILGKSWYLCPTNLDPKHSDSVAAMQEGWILELAEMSALKGYDADDVKAFLTREKDVVRLAYGKNPLEFRRHGIFIGTFNPNRYAGYLKDTTGNRRFLPVTCGKNTRFEELKRDVDQLWAEAMVKHNAGYPIYIPHNSPVAKLADAEVSSRITSDAWESIIGEYVTKHKIRRTTISSIYVDCLTRPIGLCSRSEQVRISTILKDLGFTKVRSRTGTNYEYVLTDENVNVLNESAIEVTADDEEFRI